jgi:hypothetical protein
MMLRREDQKVGLLHLFPTMLGHVRIDAIGNLMRGGVEKWAGVTTSRFSGDKVRPFAADVPT